MSEVLNLAKKAKAASHELLSLSTQSKNEMLLAVSKALKQNQDKIISENQKDIISATNDNLSPALIDRLTLTPARISAMSEALVQLASIDDPIGEITAGWRHPNGMQISKVRSPLGVIAMIYESRPNVTIEAASLALKSQNAIILRGSRAAKHSNSILCDIFVREASALGLPDGAISLVRDESRESIIELASADKFIDVLIPRGGVGLKEFIKEHAKVPLIHTGAGVCHTYVDDSADLNAALKIVKNAKMHRPSACNALECLLVHESIAQEFIHMALSDMNEVEFRLSSALYDKFKEHKNAQALSEDDYGQEFLSLVLAVKVVASVDEAIGFINTHSSNHSDAIISQDYTAVERFLNGVDSAVVYANASTRFSDGGEFGFGGEIGIATQKLHARGPMGVLALTSERYIVRANSQIRS